MSRQGSCQQIESEKTPGKLLEDVTAYDGRPRDSVVSFSDCPTPRKSSLPTASILRRSHSPLTEPRVQFSSNPRSAAIDNSNADSETDCTNKSNLQPLPVVRSKVPIVRLQETNDDSDWPPPPPTFQPIREQYSLPLQAGQRRSPRLQRGNALDAGDGDAQVVSTEQTWLGAESQL
jgi:hypothetical protein